MFHLLCLLNDLAVQIPLLEGFSSILALMFLRNIIVNRTNESVTPMPHKRNFPLTYSIHLIIHLSVTFSLSELMFCKIDRGIGYLTIVRVL